MEFKISSRHVELTDALREHARSKTERLPRYYDRLREVNVVLDEPDREFTVELIMSIEHEDQMVAQSRGRDLYALIDEATEKAERQLKDLKERRRNRKHPT